jgi:hypothetical protein
MIHRSLLCTDSRPKSLRQRSERLRSVKQAMMQELLTGRTRFV